MSFQFLKIEKQNKIWTLTLNRPESLNALNMGVLEELSQIFSEAQAAFPKECLGMVITGAGEKSFVAGADIKELSDLDKDAALEFALKGQKVFVQVEQLPFPVVAAVNGFALGGGLELALSCDFIYASESARFGLPEVSLGLIPGFGGTVRLSRVVGLNFAREMILTGEMIKADQAFSMGLVNKILPTSELMPAAQKALSLVGTRGPLAVRTAKRKILQTFDQDVVTAMKTEAEGFSGLFTSKDVAEGISAFLEKRKAQFQGN